MLKYDWYDPNIHVTENKIGAAGTNMSSADISFKTLGMGYAYYFNSQTKLILYYEEVRNSETQLAGYTKDLKDNVFTCRLQFRF